MQEKFNHVLLLLARQYRERSQSEVARSAGLNQGHYSRIENGLLPEGPSEDSVNRIAKALGFPVAFFYQPERAVGMPLSVHPFHRKKQGVGERVLKRVHAELNFRLIHLRKLLESVETDRPLPLPWIDVDEGGGPREIARKMRVAWMIPPGPVHNLTELAERAGIIVVWCEFGAAIGGVTMMVPDMPPVVFLNRSTPADRMRASLAHEIGHAIMHRVPTDTIEDEAYTFGAELLVPEKELRRDLIGGRLTLERLARLKAKWRVSMQFLLYQAKDIGCISPYQSEYLWKNISRLGWRTKEPIETDFPHEEPGLFGKILKLHSDELDYSFDDFSNLFRMEANDLRYLYGLQDSMRLRSHLHIAK
jgi:Zn-dependent peptidase ImmA (M78 family)/transcriptional regulator with XRE-family HTH domain